MPTLAQLAAIVNSFSRSSLISKLSYIGHNSLTEVTHILLFIISLVAHQSILTHSTFRSMAQKYHLSKLTSLATQVAYADMDTFIDMLETRWVRGIQARWSGSSSADIINLKICIPDTPDLPSFSRLMRIHDIQDQLKVNGAQIELVDTRILLSNNMYILDMWLLRHVLTCIC